MRPGLRTSAVTVLAGTLFWVAGLLVAGALFLAQAMALTGMAPALVALAGAIVLGVGGYKLLQLADQGPSRK